MKQEVMRLSRPIILQNLIVYLVMAAENLIIARILPGAFAALTLTTQIYNITSLVIQGITGGGNILFAKYFGENDHAHMRYIIRYEFLFTTVFIGSISAACLFAPRMVMSILTDHQNLIDLGGIYIRIMGLTWLLASCSMIVTQVLRTMGEAAVPMKIAAAEVTLELGTAVLIALSGLAPDHKLQWIAIGFLTLKAVEFAVLWCYWNQKTAGWMRGGGEQVRGFLRPFVQTVLPVTANELLWSLGISLLVMFVGRQSQTVISAYGICMTAESLSGVLMSGLDLSGSMVLGRNLVHGREAVIDIRKTLRRLALRIGVLEIAVLLGMLLAPRVYGLGEEVSRLAAYLLLIDAGVELFKAAQCMNMTGILRPLGDVRFCFLNDTLFQWLYIIPGTWLLLNVVQAPFAAVFFFMKTDQIIKLFTSEKRIETVLEKNYAESSKNP